MLNNILMFYLNYWVKKYIINFEVLDDNIGNMNVILCF